MMGHPGHSMVIVARPQQHVQGCMVSIQLDGQAGPALAPGHRLRKEPMPSNCSQTGCWIVLTPADGASKAYLQP